MSPKPFFDPTTLEGQCSALGWVPPSRRKPAFNGTPRRGQYFWVDFPHDAYAPEFFGEHPGIVVRAAQNMQDTCIIVPVTSTPPVTTAPHIHQLARNPNPLTPTRPVWAICNHLYTVHVARLRPCKAKYGNNIFPTVDRADMTEIYQRIAKAVLPAGWSTPKKGEGP
ncbi:type II toxin-antitoxin system PemK/MazF family toxin [Roseomonas sp. DSM 102946]|nr:type II toxin-antitoxin system PemK/MazF family toxin [Roseomonas sp. DSM 102946]